MRQINWFQVVAIGLVAGAVMLVGYGTINQHGHSKPPTNTAPATAGKSQVVRTDKVEEFSFTIGSAYKTNKGPLLLSDMENSLDDEALCIVCWKKHQKQLGCEGLEKGPVEELAGKKVSGKGKVSYYNGRKQITPSELVVK